MRATLSIFAALALCSQISIAEVQDDAVSNTPQATGESTMQEKSGEQNATDSQARSLEHDLTPSLQSKLEQQMSFEFEARPQQTREIASTH